MSYYSNKKKTDPKNAGNDREGSPKDINDPYYGTGSAPANTPPGDHSKTNMRGPKTVHHDYDASKNSGGNHSSDIEWED